jgi:hypothetical protein
VRSTSVRLWVVVVALQALGCGKDTPADGIDAPCTRTRDCLDGLLCKGGFCDAADGGVSGDSGSQTDASSQDAFDGE